MIIPESDDVGESNAHVAPHEEYVLEEELLDVVSGR
jgi:hypothetical protein